MSTLLFPLGRCCITPGAQSELESANVVPQELLRRHQSGDWERMSKKDQAVNREAVRNGSRVFSAYEVTDAKILVWVITEADRSSTTILLPEEY